MNRQPGNSGEGVEMIQDDLDLDSLLQAAEALVSKQHKTDDSYQPVQYESRKAQVHCETCNITYTGDMVCVVGMDNLYDNYSSKWCPKCISKQAVLWWRQCFRLSNVEGVQDGQRSAINF